MINTPVITDRILKILKIFEFLSPEYLKISISLLSNNFINNLIISDADYNFLATAIMKPPSPRLLFIASRPTRSDFNLSF